MSRTSDHLPKQVFRGRRPLCAALAALYATAAVGVPLPLGQWQIKSGELFPCSICSCGCATAEQCWRSCCCHSLAERIAWARKHNVRPPEYAIAAAQTAGLDLAWLGLKSKPTCCQCVAEKPLPACCQNRAATTCCDAAHGCCGHSHDERKDSERSVGNVVGWQALACHGHALNWLAATPTLVAERPTVSYESPIFDWLGPTRSESAQPLSSSPEVPPPEIA